MSIDLTHMLCTHFLSVLCPANTKKKKNLEGILKAKLTVWRVSIRTRQGYGRDAGIRLGI